MHPSGMRTVCFKGHLRRDCLSHGPGVSASGSNGLYPFHQADPLGRHLWTDSPCPLHAGMHTPLWTEFLTRACENITFLLLLLRMVITSDTSENITFPQLLLRTVEMKTELLAIILCMSYTKDDDLFLCLNGMSILST